MSRRVQFVLLCEDTQHEAFLRRFLRHLGLSSHMLRVERAPAGRGAGEQYVRERFVRELAFLRRRHARHALAVMIDGDAAGHDGRLKALEEACRRARVAPRQDDEPVLILVPTRSIETWLAYLEGESVDENTPYPKLDRARECAPQVEILWKMCRAESLRHPAPASLRAACEEYHLLRRWMRHG